MDIAGSVAFVTGANRGLGRQIALELLRRGATVYAGARDPGTVDIAGAIPVRVDVTDAASLAEAAAVASTTTLLVNNAGITGWGGEGGLLDVPDESVRAVMDTNYFGVLNATRAFAPVIEANGGGAVLDVLSVLSWWHPAGSGAYAASKAAAWALTNTLRAELAPRGIRVSGLHVGYMDTDMTEQVDAPKTDPAEIAVIAVDGIAAGVDEIIADEVSRQVKSGLSA
ncbi:MAG: SDR family NAD(P)-dependent oxidoreductase [Herbiconiux sp.]|uniref:SDR family oxidoreductase n=1 Tax=Herbiconiux sp. TaxID=1871186 RepID=UPI0011F4B3D5|nr:SDR family oxidoreductase [Herbiconiux sp.]TAJ49416.1 MAG: SDR family NAD(P)-dependent oxidoreductase [Herbiconiux sp.]